MEEWIAGLEDGSAEAHLSSSPTEGPIPAIPAATIAPAAADVAAEHEPAAGEAEATPSDATDAAREPEDDCAHSDEATDEDEADDEGAEEAEATDSRPGFLARLRLKRKRHESSSADEDSPTDEEPAEVAYEDARPDAADEPADALAAEAPEDGDGEDLLAPEEPQIKAHPFASRQQKEAKALEAELVGRVNELRERIIDLMAEESRLNGVIEEKRRDAAELKGQVDRAHEEHDLLDQLAKTRRREMEDETDRADEIEFRAFIDAQTEAAAAPAVALTAVPDLAADEGESVAEEGAAASSEERAPAPAPSPAEHAPVSPGQEREEPAFELPALEFPPLEFAEGVL